MKKSIFCLLLCFVLLISCVRPASAAEVVGFELSGFRTERAISFWKNFDIYSAANAARDEYGSVLPFLSGSLTPKVFYGYRLSYSSVYDVPILCLDTTIPLSPYTSLTLPVGEFVNVSNSSDYVSYGASIPSSYVQAFLFLCYEDVYKNYLLNKITGTAYYLRPDTRIFPLYNNLDTTSPDCYISVAFENLGVFYKGGIVDTYSMSRCSLTPSIYYASYWFVPAGYEQTSEIDGIWKANDTVTTSASFSEGVSVNFTSGLVSYNGMLCPSIGSTGPLYYQSIYGTNSLVYDGSWNDSSYQTVDFGSTPQSVPVSFYNWLTANYTRVGDSGSSEEVSTYYIYEHSSKQLLATITLPSPNRIYAVSNGISICDFDSGSVLYNYVWKGLDDFAGFTTVASVSPDSENAISVGEFTSNNAPSYSLFLFGADDLSSSGGSSSGGSSGGSDSGTDATEPTPTTPEPTEDPLDKEQNAATNQGNSSISDVIDVIPDISADILEAFSSLMSAVSYEGTECKLVIPAISLPALDGICDEIAISEPLEVDLGYWVDQMPVELMAIVRSLFTAGLVIYCCKEVYSLFEYAISLKWGKPEDDE